MVPTDKDIPLFLLIYREETRRAVTEILTEHFYSPVILRDPDEAVEELRGRERATVFVDCEVVLRFGVGLYSRLKVASPGCRLVLFCHKEHQGHREIIREAMEIGVYACLLAPVEDWEVLAIVRHLSTPRPGRRRLPRRKHS